jgi:hypothetical protein
MALQAGLLPPALPQALGQVQQEWATNERGVVQVSKAVLALEGKLKMMRRKEEDSRG